MKPHLVSREVLARQVYRYHAAYRLAAFVLLFFILLQVPAAVWFVYEFQIRQQRDKRAAELAAESATIAKERKGLEETEKKLRRIQELAPILRARLPLSAVMAKIEQIAPPELVLSRVTIEAEEFQPVQVETSVFRIPRQISIVLEGEQNAPGADKVFAQKLIESLPPGSKTVDQSSSDGQKTFRLGLVAPASGNYFGLGVTKIGTQNSL
jgi:hypothetical protein